MITFNEFVNEEKAEFSDFGTLQASKEMLRDKILDLSVENQNEMAKALVAAMKDNRPDLVEVNYRNSYWSSGNTHPTVEVGFKPIKLEMNNGASHRIYANFYSSADRKKVIEALMNTANSLGAGTYSFKEWYGKMRDYYSLWDLLFLASAVGVDLEQTIGKFVSLKNMRGTVLGKSLNL